MSPDVSVTVRFYPPPQDLQRYFTTFYHMDIAMPRGETVQELLQPEWANLRFFQDNVPDSWIEGESRLSDVRFVATGPSSTSGKFSIGATRFWGLGLLPLGWARFVGRLAADHANLIADGHRHPAFAGFVPLADTLFGPRPDEAGELERIVAFFRGFPPRALRDAPRIAAIHAALIDPNLVSVAGLVAQVGASQRTVERLCQRHFGFPPKLLLRRQRFLRSLAQFMLDPSLKWIGAMDSTYHDQAQFVRDFREFMGVSPREYAAMPHPLLEKFITDRARVHGARMHIPGHPGGTKD